MLKERNREILSEWREHWQRLARITDDIIRRCDEDPDYGRYVQIRLASFVSSPNLGEVILSSIIHPSDWDSAVADLSDAALRYTSELLRNSVADKIKGLGFSDTSEAIAYVQARKDRGTGTTP